MNDARNTPTQTAARPVLTARPALRFRNTGWLAALIAIALVAAVACGASDDTAAVAPAEASPAQPTAAPAAAAVELIRNQRGPELTGNQMWFNGEPTTIGRLAADGEVVLIDFWTYTCINCIRTFPFLKEWDRKYGDRGLTILGVHSPEFEFEKVADNVQAAIDRYGLEYPVVQDNDMDTWRAFNNRFWPGKYLFNTNGAVIYTHFGEGEYVETEQQIRDALTAAGHDISDIPIGTEEGPERDPLATGQTRELYGGFGRNYSYNGLYAGQPEYYDAPDIEVFYMDTIPHRDGQWYLQGVWRNAEEAIVHARETENLEDYIAFKFLGRSVNVVVDPPTEGAVFDVFVELDGNPLPAGDAGDDIQFDNEGRSYFKVDGGREYRVIEQQEWGEREIKLRSNSPDFAMFAVTFGSNLEGA